MIKRFVILQDEQLVAARAQPSRGCSRTRPPSPRRTTTACRRPTRRRRPRRRRPYAPPPATAEAETDEDDERRRRTGRVPPSQEGRRLAEVAREAALGAERTVIAETLRQVHWNRRKAAQLLGVSYKTLLNKIKETGIERP